MILSVIKAALCTVHGTKKIEKEVSGYYLSNEISAVYQGMLIAIPEEEWKAFRKLSRSNLVKLLKRLSKNVKLSLYLKHPRGPKKPVPKRKSDSKTPHVSTAKILAARKRK